MGFLGERAQFGWWPTAFYDASARLFLEPIFSKTPQIAQYHGVVEAARRLHDEHLNVGTYHLFRLPEELEQDLHLLVRDESEKLSPENLLRDKKTALDALIEVSKPSDRNGIGPVAIGSIGDISRLLKDISAVYAAAFVSNTQSFPYLVR